MDDRNKVRQEMLTNYEGIIADMEKVLDPKGGSVLINTPYIVTVDGIAFDPEVVDGKVSVGPVRFGLPHKVRRFLKRDAENIAKSATNGHGHQGKAVFWVDATIEMLERLRLVVLQIKESDFYN